MSNPALTAIHLCRKSLDGTVAANALKWGTGSLNIEGTRLGNRVPDSPATTPATPISTGRTHGHRIRAPYVIPKGRWPANVILMHRDQCRLVGHHYEDFLINVYAEGLNHEGYAGGSGEPKVGEILSEGNGQMVEDWECVEGCPVAELDRCSGILSSGRTPQSRGVGSSRSGPSGHRGQENLEQRSWDSGGASRYFKQVQSKQDLIDYLCTMIGAPGLPGLYCQRSGEELTTWLAETGNNMMPGIVLDAVPTEEQAAELLRVLMPGGHLCLIAPDEQPTGHTGTVRVEDAGFEIRDCILLVREPGRFHYVAKAARAEREAGCQKLPVRAGFEAVGRKEGSAGVQNPRAGAGRTAKTVHNMHPTVKPIALMERLLADVPKEARVLDPFLGSGTTGIACSKQERDFVGIEREAEYLAIADARIRHWDSSHKGWRGATIVSDVAAKEEAPRELTLDDMFRDD